jgi:hypothetical protein
MTKKSLALLSPFALMFMAGCKDTTSPNPAPGPATKLVFIFGQNQTALAGTSVQTPLVVQARDKSGKPVPGVPVTFTVLEGGGTVQGSPITTDYAGNATSPPWTLGKSALPQLLGASTTAGTSVTVSATVQTAYNIDLRFFGPPLAPSTIALFTNAAARISGAVVGDVPDFPASLEPQNLVQLCRAEGLPVAFAEPIDDVLIFASVGPIDGPKNILAFAGPCAARTGVNRQSLIGVMKFDSEDIDSLLARGNFQDVVQHEMLHIVGIGTLWSSYRVVAGLGTQSVRFTGALGVSACIQIGAESVCPSSVPVENQGGPGTRDAHWREATFGSELMTGFVTQPSPGFTGILNPFSLISIQSLIDVGYVVNTNAADPYAVPGTTALREALGIAPVETTEWEQVLTPRAIGTERGQLIPLTPGR